MSPSECHGGQFAHSGSYSPQFNDVWSLGIILLNLLTGRSPWRSASLSDPAFSFYLQDPTRFFSTVLPISDEVDVLLVHVLDVDWRRRLTVAEMKEYVKRIGDFYSDDVAFEGSAAHFTWEPGMNVGSNTEESLQAEVIEVPKTNASVPRWSSDPGSAVKKTPATEPSSLTRRYAVFIKTTDREYSGHNVEETVIVNTDRRSALLLAEEVQGRIGRETTNEKNTRPSSWTPVDLSSSSHEYDTLSSSSPVSAFFGTIYDLLFRGKATLRGARPLWHSPLPHLPPNLQRSRRIIWPKRSRMGIRAVQ